MNQGASLDQATGWSSTYLMVKQLLELKDVLVYITHPDVCLFEAQWKNAENLECLLRHPFPLTKNFQTDHLTPGTFHEEQKKCYLSLHRLVVLCRSHEKIYGRHEKILLDNECCCNSIC